MMRLTRHRGPDDSLTSIAEGLALGANRLAIVGDRRKPGALYKSADGQIVALFNGEIVNHHELCEKFSLAIRTSRGHSDGEVIVPLYRALGADFVRQLAGMFAIALADLELHRVLLYRDRLGVKPLYYAIDKTEVVFSSELKAVVVARHEHVPPAFEAVDHILTMRFPPGRQTPFAGIQRLLPGEYLSIEVDGCQRQTYWTMPTEADALQTGSDSAIGACVEHVVAEYSQADVAGGFFLSGGLDSRNGFIT